MFTTIATENATINHGGAEILEVICDEDGRDYGEVVELEKDELIQVMLRLHQAKSRRKWRSMV